VGAALHHALLGLSVAALAAAALRAAAPLAERGLPRAIVAVTFAAAAAVAEALALGLVSLSGSWLALGGAAIATWAAARALLPVPAVPPSAELAQWWAQRTAPERAAVGAVAGAAGAWAAWQLRNPAIGFDSIHYHLPEIVAWLDSGRTGSVENLIPALPTGNYPITAEVSVAWAMGISRSFAPFTLWPWAAVALIAASGWTGLRSLAVPRLPAALAIGALCTNPWLLAWQSNGSMTDPPALAWLVTCAALCALARERPVLLGPALLAAGLAVGTKTTALPLAALVLALGSWGVRGDLGRLRVALAAGLAAAVAVGGVWYLRNLITHGSPFWPIVDTPWGDPVPRSVTLVETSFLDRPGVTVDRLGDAYLDRFGGGLALLAGGLLAPLLARRRRVLAAGAATAAALLVWANAPVTGVPPTPGLEETIFSTTRYLLPAVAAGALSLALAAGAGRRASPLAALVLGAVIVLDLVQTFDLGFPTVPRPLVPLAGAAAGAALAVALGIAGARLRGRGASAPGGGREAGAAGRARLAVFAAAPAAALAFALLAIPASDFVERHGAATRMLTSPVVHWLATQPDYRDGDQRVAISPAPIGPLAGSDLAHPVDVFGRGEPCPAIAERARDQWLVVYGGPLGGAVPADVRRCLAGRRPAFDNRLFAVYRPGS
jgi:hypothetical protein